MRKFNHPNIAKLYEVFDTDNHLVLVLEYMDRGNLSKKIKQGKIDERQALRMVRPMFDALAYMHRLRVVHRDLKPANLMFKSSENGDYEVLKVIDFGLCADVDDKSKNSLLDDKSGTVAYLAPELIAKKKGEFYDEKVDVFSAGMILYEM